MQTFKSVSERFHKKYQIIQAARDLERSSSLQLKGLWGHTRLPSGLKNVQGRRLHNLWAWPSSRWKGFFSYPVSLISTCAHCLSSCRVQLWKVCLQLLHDFWVGTGRLQLSLPFSRLHRSSSLSHPLQSKSCSPWPPLLALLQFITAFPKLRVLKTRHSQSLL